METALFVILFFGAIFGLAFLVGSVKSNKEAPITGTTVRYWGANAPPQQILTAVAGAFHARERRPGVGASYYLDAVDTNGYWLCLGSGMGGEAFAAEVVAVPQHGSPQLTCGEFRLLRWMLVNGNIPPNRRREMVRAQHLFAQVVRGTAPWAQIAFQPVRSRPPFEPASPEEVLLSALPPVPAPPPHLAAAREGPLPPVPAPPPD